jgi:hypothetical protein
MKFIKILNISLTSFFILFFFFTKFFGFFSPKFENYDSPNAFISLKKIANKQLEDKIQGFVLICDKKLTLIPIFKMPIGEFLENGVRKVMDSQGGVYDKTDEPNLINIEGSHSIWPIYYEKLQKAQILPLVYAARIYDYRIDLYLLPGVVVQLGKNVDDLKEFLENFSDFFQPNTLIDLRDPQKVGISKINLIPKKISKKK